MKRRIQVIYDGEPDRKLDEAICEAMDTVIGADWNSQGFDFLKGKRDLNFDLREGEQS
jgi:hypothetical protein